MDLRDGGVERCALLLPVGDEFRKSGRLQTSSGENVTSNRCRFFDDANSELFFSGLFTNNNDFDQNTQRIRYKKIFGLKYFLSSTFTKLYLFFFVLCKKNLKSSRFS